MWVAIGEEPESGTGWVSAFNHPHHLLRAPVRNVAVFGEMPRSVEIIVVAHPVCELLTGIAPVAEEELIVVPRHRVVICLPHLTVHRQTRYGLVGDRHVVSQQHKPDTPHRERFVRLWGAHLFPFDR